MEQDLKKKSKMLTYAIMACVCLLVFMAAYMYSNGKLSDVMGNSVYDNEKYAIGNEIEYANTNWYIISENEKSFSLLKKEVLTKEEINSLGLNIQVNENGAIPYDYKSNCNETNQEGCSTNLESSTIGTVLNTWQRKNLNINELVTVGDYTISLINDDYLENLKNYDWLYLNNYYWTMSTPNYSGINIYGLYNDKSTHIQMVYDGTNEISGGLVRPVINVSKDAI